MSIALLSLISGVVLRQTIIVIRNTEA